MQPLVKSRVLCVDVDLTVGKLEALTRLFIEDDIERYLLAILAREEWMLHHLLPVRALRRILLHGLAEEFEAGEANFDVLRPGPRAFLDLTVEELQGHLIRSLLLDVEDEHACEHLIKDDSDGPDINLMTVTLSTTPISLDLLRRHHQRGALEREGAVIADFAHL